MRRSFVSLGRLNYRPISGKVAHRVAMIQAAKENPKISTLEWLNRKRVSTIETPHAPEVAPIRIPAPAFFTQHEELTLGAAAGKAYDEHRGLADYARLNGIFSDSEFLVHAIEEENLEAVRTMLYRGNFRRSINDIDPITRKYPLEVAIEKHIDNPGSIDFKKMVDWLLEDGADPNIRTRDGDTLLSMVLRKSQSYRLAKILLENGTDPNVLDKDEKFPLAYVVTEFDLTELLINNGSLILPRPFLVRDGSLSDEEQKKIRKTSGVMMNILRSGHGIKKLPFLYQKQIRQCLEYGLELADEETYQRLVDSRYDNVRDLNDTIKILKDGICLKYYELSYLSPSRENLDKDGRSDLKFIAKYVEDIHGYAHVDLGMVKSAISAYAVKLISSRPTDSPSSPKGKPSGNSPDDPSRIP